MNKVHYLKTWPEYFWNVVIGNKRFEVRKDDRDYESGDKLVLQEFDPEKQEYTGKEDSYVVSYLLRDKPPFTPEGYVIMSLTPAEEMNERDQLRASLELTHGALQETVTILTNLRDWVKPELVNEILISLYPDPFGAIKDAETVLADPTAQHEAKRVRAMEKLLRDIVNDLERPEQGELPPWKLDLLQRSKAVLGGGK